MPRSLPARLDSFAATRDLGVQGLPAAVEAKKGILNDVLGGGLVTGHQDGKLHQGQGVRPVQRRDELPGLQADGKRFRGRFHALTDAVLGRRLPA